MGYHYAIKIDRNGNQYGTCDFPDKTSCDAWDFYKGKAGQEFSYCVKKGHGIETKVAREGFYTKEFSVCIPNNSRSQEIPMIDLMVQNGDFPEPVGKHSGAGGRISKKRTLEAAKHDFSAYWLRHSYAQGLLSLGRSIYEIKEMMGHQNIRSSQRYL